MTNNKEARLKAVEAAMKQINKTVKSDSGDALLTRFGDSNHKVERFSSGSLVLDSLLGGGMAKGRIIEIYGPEASGKTSIALTATGNIQRSGGVAAFIDLENAIDPFYAQTLGVNMDELLFAQPEHGEQALTLVEELINSAVVDLITIDSVAALLTRGEMEGNVEDLTVASKARLLSRFLPRIIRSANQTGTTVIFINQEREGIGKFSPRGTPSITTGGKALPYYASQRVRVARVGQIKEGKDVIGNEVKLSIKKNKTGRPFLESTTVLTFGSGINRAAELIEVGPQYGTILRPNNRTYVEAETGEVLGTSKAEAVQRLATDSEVFNRISVKFADDVRAALENNTPELKAAKGDEEDTEGYGE